MFGLFLLIVGLALAGAFVACDHLAARIQVAS